MNNGSVVADRAEEIKWWDALDWLRRMDFTKGLRMARDCRHLDAQWLACLYQKTPRPRQCAKMSARPDFAAH
jgi:hypothetical protein